MKEIIKKGNDLKVNIYSKFMKKITAITTIIVFIFSLLPAQMVFALNGSSSLTTPEIPVSSVTLDKTSEALTVGYTDQLTAAVAPDNATNKSVTWASDNTAVAAVSDTGLVTAVSAGTAIITVTTADGSMTAACAVTVVTPPTFVSATTNAYGSQVQIKFNKEMATPLPAAPAGFKLTVDGVETTIKSVSLNSDKTIINLGLPFGVSLSNGQTITVAYTAGTVKAADGGVLESFDTKSVSNVILPVFVSASTNASGTNVALKFNAKMLLPESYAGFTIKADGVIVPISEVRQDIDPTILNFGLSSPVNFGQIVTIAYSSTIGGPVTDINLVLIGTRGDFGVMNIVPQSAPTVKSAVTSGPNHVILTMDSPLRGTTGDPSAFIVTGAASNPNVTSTAVSGEKVILTLDKAIASGETITVSYTKTGTNNLTNGAEADSFNQAVTNNIIAVPAAPTIKSAATNITGKVITVTFDKAMAVLPDGPAGFAVYVNGVGAAVTAAYLNSDPTKINLTLSSPVLYGQLVTITYTPGTVTADDGGILKIVTTKSNQTIFNGTLANGVISTFAGSFYNSLLGYAGNDVSATDSTVKLNYPNGITTDGSGNIYFADSSNSRIREIAATTHAQFGISMTAGNIYTVAGNGIKGIFGDGNIATSANLYGPTSVAIDSEGNLYIADATRIRKVDVNGIITNFAGDANGKSGYSGDGGAAVNALFKNINDITIDSSGNIYITDSDNYVVRKIDKNGIITTVAGNGAKGALSADILTNNPDNPTLSTNTPLNNPQGIKVDGDGNIYFTDMGNQVALEIPAADHTQFGIHMLPGNIYNIAGNGVYGDTGIGGLATSASISNPTSITLDNAGNVFISESTTQYIKRVNTDGIISVVAGSGSKGYSPDNTLATSAKLYGIRKLALDSDGNLLFSETNLIRIVHPDTSAPVITLAGNPTVNIANGEIYTDEGISITDNNGTGIKTTTTYTKDGNRVGSIDTNIAGIYIIHYNVSDASYNAAAEVTRTVIVAPSAPNVTADDTLNKIVGIDSTMEYSFDNVNWTNYLSNPNPDLSGDLTVYVRVAADSETGLPAGAVTTLNFKVNPTYTVTYNGNGNISGVAPVDTGSYLQGAKANVLGNTNGLSRTGYTFVGWNTKADGSGTNYMPGTTLTLGAGNTTLYAKWISNPSIPASVKAASASYNSIKISWGAVSGASGYQVFRAASSTGTYSLIATTTSLSYINSGLTTNSTYYYKVKAYKAIGTVKAYSSYSAAVSTKPIPSAPASVKAASASYNSIKVSWGVVTGASGYQVYSATSSTGTYSLLITTASLSCINSGLTTGKTYYYKVRAYRTVGTIKVYSGYSAIVYSKTILSAPANLKAVRYSTTSIKLTWSGAAGASGYVVYRATSSTGTYSLIKTTSYLSYTNTGLTRYRTYYYKIRAYRSVGTTRIYSNWSTVVSAKPY